MNADSEFEKNCIYGKKKRLLKYDKQYMKHMLRVSGKYRYLIYFLQEHTNGHNIPNLSIQALIN